MSLLRVHGLSVSIDGYAAGPAQSLDNPMGVGGMALHEWVFPTRTFHAMNGEDGGETGLDDDYAARGVDNIGAWILGRNMFGPGRGDWPKDDDWKGWWGDEPPYHCDAFILTHHARASIPMQGGTTFHFVTEGIHAALERAKASADGKDVRIGGGASTIRQYFQAQLIDQAHFVIAGTLLGAGEAMWAGLDLPALGYGVSKFEPTTGAAHLVISKL